MCENYNRYIPITLVIRHTSNTYRIHIEYISNTYQTYFRYLSYYLICAWYLYYVYPIFIIIYRVPNKSMICYRYFTTWYVCEIITIFILYVTEFLHLYYTYQVPDMRVFVKYRTHILCISHTYLVPDMCPITSILTCVDDSHHICYFC